MAITHDECGGLHGSGASGKVLLGVACRLTTTYADDGDGLWQQFTELAHLAEGDGQPWAPNSLAMAIVMRSDRR